LSRSAIPSNERQLVTVAHSRPASLVTAKVGRIDPGYEDPVSVEGGCSRLYDDVFSGGTTLAIGSVSRVKSTTGMLLPAVKALTWNTRHPPLVGILLVNHP
jgi:hypothetical protein